MTFLLVEASSYARVVVGAAFLMLFNSQKECSTEGDPRPKKMNKQRGKS